MTSPLETLLTEIVLQIFQDPLLAVLIFGSFVVLSFLIYRVSGGAAFIISFILIAEISFLSDPVLYPLKGLMYAATGVMVVYTFMKLGGQ